MSSPTQQHFGLASNLPVRPEWLALWDEPILEPELPIVDPHHHLWERPDWRYLLHELLADLSTGHNIVATVFLQCRSMHRANGPEELRPVGETEFVNGVAAMSASGGYGPSQVCAGIVGYADMRLGARVRDVLEAHQRAGGGRFRGIRHIVAWDEDQNIVNPSNAVPRYLMADQRFREGLKVLASMALTFDAWLYHPQIPELTELARAMPDLQIVANHCCGPLGINAYASRTAEVFDEWSRSTRELARCPNVHMKLGGIGMRINGLGVETRPKPVSSVQLADTFRPFFEVCIEAFGANRCMFESNFPVDKGSYPYAAYWNACKVLTKGASQADKTALFSGTAARFYNLEG
ncbi:MAG: amidohydrolase family protein [Chloroflexi bacterium]|nr:amidohydrolase family protein [Chloroflexota bacterium]